MQKTDKWQCSVCHYIYDVAKGDPFKAPPGTAFETLTDDWTCPICGVTKEKYIPAPPDISNRRRRARKK